ncbi:MAG: hypothetical protein O4808_06725 [Trichodesmium sp. St17_bin3_1_1]|nr:hypothetical protein [Trichodesmium sp. St18_bin1]MDE5106760.1 hypothetical protein [Trichodesmium sp. St17_bin3_1_1]MDE5118900.1 hypothetical protein [Trichodesmium sp. St19_bin1]
MLWWKSTNQERKNRLILNGDENAVRNLLAAGGHAPDKKNGQVGQDKTATLVAAA